ncbi:MAG: ribonuclease P protein component [Planctomycetes bacterium]|nr:ribonuclease P protein component [Planctomycetota bacterium]
MSLFAYPKSARLLRRREFDRVFKAGGSWKDGDLVVYCLQNDLPQARLGIVIGRKVKRAVDRNRIKRWIREAFRLHPEAVPPGVDLVVLPRNAPSLTWARAERSLLKLLGARARDLARRGTP